MLHLIFNNDLNLLLCQDTQAIENKKIIASIIVVFPCFMTAVTKLKLVNIPTIKNMTWKNETHKSKRNISPDIWSIALNYRAK